MITLSSFKGYYLGQIKSGVNRPRWSYYWSVDKAFQMFGKVLDEPVKNIFVDFGNRVFTVRLRLRRTIRLFWQYKTVQIKSVCDKLCVDRAERMFQGPQTVKLDALPSDCHKFQWPFYHPLTQKLFVFQNDDKNGRRDFHDHPSVTQFRQSSTICLVLIKTEASLLWRKSPLKRR